MAFEGGEWRQKQQSVLGVMPRGPGSPRRTNISRRRIRNVAFGCFGNRPPKGRGGEDNQQRSQDACGVGMSVVAEDNARLLFKMASNMGACGLGHISNFFDVEPNWKCPCCYRAREEFSRIDGNGKLLCRIVSHHDHFHDFVEDQLPKVDWKLSQGVCHVLCCSHSRFPPTLVCEDCNNADASAKKIVGAPKEFSFTPFGFTGFIVVSNNLPHSIDKIQAHSVYEAAIHSMRMLAGRLREMKRGLNDSSNDSWEPVGSPVNRAMHTLKAAMKAKDAAE
jgi:hypothetical protein